MVRAIRGIKLTGLAAALLAFASLKAHAQYEFLYSVYGNYSTGGNGSPFSNLLCSDSTANIQYDNNSGTSVPKFSTALCSKISPAGNNFGAQFFAYMFTWTGGNFTFYVGSDDGSSLFIDGQDRLDILPTTDPITGDPIFTSESITIPLGPLTHTFELDYYASAFDPLGNSKAVQATVDPGLNVTTFDETTRFHGTATPEPSSIVLFATGLGVLGIGVHSRRRRSNETSQIAQSAA